MADDQNNSILKLFGFELRRNKAGTTTSTGKQKLESPVVPTDPDGAGYTTSGAGYYGQYINIEGDQAKDNHQLIMRYRGVAMHPEVDMAIDEIVNESVVVSENQTSVELALDEIEALSKELEDAPAAEAAE